MARFFLLGQSLAAALGLKLELGREVIDLPPSNGWRRCAPGPAFLKISRKA